MTALGLPLRFPTITLGYCSGGIAATEFAVIVPLKLVMFFGTVEFCRVSRSVFSTILRRSSNDVPDFLSRALFGGGAGRPAPHKQKAAQKRGLFR